MASDGLYSIDPANGNPERLYAAAFNGFYLSGLKSDTGASTCSLLDGNRLFVFDVTTGQLLASPTLQPSMQGAVGVGNGRFVGLSSGTVYSISIPAGTPAPLAPVSFTGGGFEASSLTFDPLSNRVYALSGDNKLYQIDATTGALLASPALTSTGKGPRNFYSVKV